MKSLIYLVNLLIVTVLGAYVPVSENFEVFSSKLLSSFNDNSNSSRGTLSYPNLIPVQTNIAIDPTVDSVNDLLIQRKQLRTHQQSCIRQSMHPLKGQFATASIGICFSKLQLQIFENCPFKTFESCLFLSFLVD
ncbi:hypothetical protein BC833DRAFT_596694 [Globomyces pollinis-pini]|nr:hypothetical protein BC833DRAFT_596694 [Globomyces pollinis-pini]